nr:vicilin-like seed storage protein At2g18540 [Tanacetum cinerariifolium]
MIDVLLPYMDSCYNRPIFKTVGRLTVVAAMYHVMLTYVFAYTNGRRKLSFALNNGLLWRKRYIEGLKQKQRLIRSGDEDGPTVKKDERWSIVSSDYGEITAVILELVLALWPGVCVDIDPIFMIDVLLPYMDSCYNRPIFKTVGRLTVVAAMYHVMLTYVFAYTNGRRKLSFALNNGLLWRKRYIEGLKQKQRLIRSGDEDGPTVKKDERWSIVSSDYGEITAVKISDGINGFY